MTNELKLPKFRAALEKIKTDNPGGVLVVGGESVTLNNCHYVSENRLFTPVEMEAIRSGAYADGSLPVPEGVRVTFTE